MAVLKKQPEQQMQLIEQMQAISFEGNTGALAKRLLYAATLLADKQPLTVSTMRSFTKYWDISPDEMLALADFYTPAVQESVALLLGKDGMERTGKILALYLEGRFSPAPFRRNYHKEIIAESFQLLIYLMIECVCWSFYGITPAQAMEYDTSNTLGFTHQLALSLRENDASAISAVRTAITGDNSTYLLTTQVMRAISISENPVVIELLGDLLLSAYTQDGLRQQIMLNMDWGSLNTILYFLHLLEDNGLTRFPCIVWALYAWTRVGGVREKPAFADKCIRLAIEVLENPNNIEQNLTSEDPLCIYFALWGTAVQNWDHAENMVTQLLQDGTKLRRLVAFYFVSRTGNDQFQMQTALEHLGETDEETLAWVLHLLRSTDFFREESLEYYVHGTERLYPFLVEHQLDIFNALEDICQRIGKRSKSFYGSVFPWTAPRLKVEFALDAMLRLAIKTKNDQMINRLTIKQDNLSAAFRKNMIKNLIQLKKGSELRIFLRDALTDRSLHVQNMALDELCKEALTEEDIFALCDGLSAKNSAWRNNITTLLTSQSAPLQKLALERLLTDGDEMRLQAGLSLLLHMRQTAQDKIASYLPQLRQMDCKNFSPQTQMMMEQLLPPDASEVFTLENGFGLFDPNADCFRPQRPALPSFLTEAGYLTPGEGKGGLLSDQQLHEISHTPIEEIVALFQRIYQVFINHANYEYTIRESDGELRKVLFGDMIIRSELLEHDTPSPEHPLADYPFGDELVQAAGRYATDGIALTNLLVQLSLEIYQKPVQEEWFIQKMENAIASSKDFSVLHQKIGRAANSIFSLLQRLHRQLKSSKVFAHSFQVYCSLMDNLLEEENWDRQYGELVYDSYVPAYHYAYFYSWRNYLANSITTDEDFTIWFHRMHYEACTVYDPKWQKLLSSSVVVTFQNYVRAFDLGLIPIDFIYQQLLTDPAASQNIELLERNYYYENSLLKKYPALAEIRDTVIDRIITVEENRGEAATPLTYSARKIQRFEGIEHFVTLLTALGDAHFYRGYDYLFDPSSAGDRDKTQSLSLLLRHCYPSKKDTHETLSQRLQGTGITTERLVQTAMYVPQWAGLLEGVIGWQGLKSGVWFFHAHGGRHSDEIVIYSPISKQQFCDGAFDKDWFFSVYETLGEKRFQTLYRYAQYISISPTDHRRSQLYADAVLGRLDADKLRLEIVEKRNRDKLRCYALIPLRDKQDALARYEFICQFEKDSRQFGALRRGNEQQACLIALQNLAITMGCADVDRMMWRLEGQKLDTLKPLMEPYQVGEVTLALTIGADGVPALHIEKGGKPQKSLPAALKNDTWVQSLKKAVKDLTQQRRRAVKSMETAMVTHSTFYAYELAELLQNPVLGPLVKSLLWCSGDVIGLPNCDGETVTLSDVTGVALPVSGDLFLVHPHDLVQKKIWSAWQQRIYTARMVQPFKQVFREYYPLTQDERETGTSSYRYSGNEVKPQKSAALLRGRGWIISHEEGALKVFYRENLMVCLSTEESWFMEMESASITLDTVCFYKRDNSDLKTLEDVPPTVFSEVMRDLDLMVSVANASGVDPEASHSTVEMRIAIAKELVSLLKLTNVEFIGSHAKIQGTLGKYSVHMGSGVTHAEGVGSVVIIPVRSQTRGRIFLPFADDDPKTAEVMSKILLLAEDKKIKDPGILIQITCAK